MTPLEQARADVAYWREMAHGAPLNKVFTDHKGRKSLGSHSTAWAEASRGYGKALDHLAALERPR